MKFFTLVVAFAAVHLGISQDSKVYSSNEVEVFPIFDFEDVVSNGSEGDFKNQLNYHITKTFNYPSEALEKELTGKAYVRFELDSTGVISKVQARAQEKSFEKEAIRIFEALPKAKPAKSNGRNVPFVYSWPVVFNIQMDSETSLSFDEQRKKDYFPQEQIIHEKCKNESNPNECLYLLLEQRVRKFLNSKKVLGHLSKYNKDTLETGGEVVVDFNGKVQKEKSYVAIKGVKLNKKLRSDFRSMFYDTEFEKVLFYKNPPNHSIHKFYFDYSIVKSENGVLLHHLEPRKKYNGGVIQEIPVFPGCEGLSNNKREACFQTKIQQHIKQHFKYPEEALKKGISGTVKVQVTINKDGQIENIRTKGPHHLLEEESVRIFKLVPLLKPALENGNPVKIPFSIPVHFRLN